MQYNTCGNSFGPQDSEPAAHSIGILHHLPLNILETWEGNSETKSKSLSSRSKSTQTTYSNTKIEIQHRRTVLDVERHEDRLHTLF